MSAPVLQTEGLSCGHDRPLVQDLDLVLEPGEALALVGPNGAGKTTLLCTLAGRLPPLAGAVRVQGASLAELGHAQRARRVSLLSQDDAGDATLTVRELVELGRTPHLGLWGRPRAADREAVEQALEQCQLAPLAHRRLDRVSGGERQRARIAMTVAQQSALLLLDEPVNHLDLRRRHAFFELVARMRRERGLGAVMVLHDVAEAYREADRVLVLDGQSAEQVAADDPRRVERLARAFGVPEERIPPL